MPQNILLIQENPADAKVVLDALAGDRFQVDWVRRWSQAELRLASAFKLPGCGKARIAAVIADLSLVDSSGLATLDRILQVAPHIPILVLSTAQDEIIARQSVQRGAQDYLLKTRIDNYALAKSLDSMIERAANSEALFEEKERAQITLNSIGDGVMSIDLWGRVTYLNAVAEQLTGWTLREAMGRPVVDVFRIIDALTRKPVPNPMAETIRDDRTVALTPNCVLLRRDGLEAPIEDSAAPMHDRQGQVTGAVIVFHDVSAARTQSLRMSYLAQHDSLTKLPNRTLLSDRLTQAVALAHRHGQRLAVLFLDLDHFKHINDSLGHAIGDRLLQSAAQRIHACVRGSDTVSRQGGDEFVILLPEIMHSQDAAVCAEKILQSLSLPHRIDQHDLFVTGSIGIASYPDDGIDSETLMKNADIAMYHAKSSGRNSFEFFAAEMNVRIVERQLVESGLRHAIERNELEVFYQPIMDLVSGEITGAEALLRWRHPLRGLLEPAQFIAIAEESGLIVPIGQWALNQACMQAKIWQQSGLPYLRMAFNVSAAELRARDFLDGVRAALADTGLAPHLLELELTETFLLQDLKSTTDVLSALKGLGVGLALDDFGTGYSSLTYLKRFPIDCIKIDRSFVHDLTSDADDACIVSAIISMGRNLGLRVVAEGVETRAQLAFLQATTCPEGQGYYFSKPMSSRDFTQMLRRSSVVAATA